MPQCSAICGELIPEAPYATDLYLSHIIPFLDPDSARNVSDYNDTDTDDGDFLIAGDRLVYHCRTPYWAVHGGVDEFTDEFMCTDEGVLNTPESASAWPVCKQQYNMVILGVELMLDRYDRRISDRYKLIDFREEDAQKEVVSLADYFIEVTVPTMCGK